MASFLLPSGIQKRLLRYALSRLEFLDSEVLDLEHLDIKWGTRSVLEFRAVPLRLKKLSSLLSIPSSFELTRARILLLRITVPVDVYSSPIMVEVDGVEAQLVTLSGAGRARHTASTRRSDHDRSKDNSGRTRAATSRTAHDHDETTLPSAYDLAASFVQTEPATEKAELEAAIASQSQYLSSSISVSDDGEDDVELGTGAGLTLPNFMASFLKGIADRLQLKVRGIVLNLDVSLPGESDSPSSSPIPRDIVTVQISVDDVDIEGVTTQSLAQFTPTTTSDSASHRQGQRRITLKSLSGSLITDASLFASLAKSSALASPTATQSDISETESKTASTISRNSYAKRNRSMVDGRHSPAFSRRSENSRVSSHHRPGAPSVLREKSADIAGVSTGDSAAPFEDELRESMLITSESLQQSSTSGTLEGDLDDRSLSGSLPFQSFMQQSDNTSSAHDTRSPSEIFLPPDDEPSDPVTRGLGRRPLSPHPQQPLKSTILPERPRTRYSEHRISASQPLPNKIEIFPSGASFEDTTATNVQSLGASNVTPEQESSPEASGGEEDLAMSMMFSHEQAESMYMSAVSLANEPRSMPGGWDDSIDEMETGPLDGPPDVHDIPKQASHDNLEHALQAPVTKLETHGLPGFKSVTGIDDSVHVSDRTQGHTESQDSQGLPCSSSTKSAPLNDQEDMPSSDAASDGSIRIAKRFFYLDQAAVLLSTSSRISPVGMPNDADQSTMLASHLGLHDQLAQSASPIVSGAFSSQKDSTKIPRRTSPHSNGQDEPAQHSKPTSLELSPEIEIELGCLEGRVDVSAGRLIARMLQHVKQLLKSAQASQPVRSSDETAATPPSLRVHVQAITLKFLERLIGSMLPTDQPSASDVWNRGTAEDVLLRTSIHGLDVNIAGTKIQTNTDVSVRKLAFGYSDANIVDFDAHLDMRASVVDTMSPSGGVDVLLKISQTADTTRVKVSTLPLHVVIDLQRLDETFSWFGGLSGVLNMGSSMASSVTAPAKPVIKTRSVRFDAPVRADDESVAAQNKINLRAGGFFLDLIGKHCAVGLDTTAVKLVKREEGLGMAIDLIRLSGPHLHASDKEPAIQAEVRGTRLEFLESPKDADLTRLLALITPSKAKYDDDDDILLDTLLRQRRQGSVLRVTVDKFDGQICDFKQLEHLPALSEELARLSTVAKYLPEDDRPGLLSLILIHDAAVHADVNNVLGSLQLRSKNIELAQITIPTLVATSVGSLVLKRNGTEEIIGAATPIELRESRSRLPVIMARMIGDEMDPKVKIMFWNLKAEYTVPLLLAVMDWTHNPTTEDMVASMAASVATLTGRDPRHAKLPIRSLQDGVQHDANPIKIDIALRDCILGLRPTGIESKILVVLTEAHLAAIVPKHHDTSITAELSKGSILVIDDVSNIISLSAAPRLARRSSFDGGSGQVADLCSMGFVSISYISSAKAIINIHGSEIDAEKSVDIELRNDLFVLESCADSTQTLIAALNNLEPPAPPSTDTRYRTKVIPVEDLLASLSGDAFGTAEGNYNIDEDFPHARSATESHREDEEDFDFSIDSEYIHERDLDESVEGYGHDSQQSSIFFDQERVVSQDTHDGVLLESYFQNKSADINEDEELDFREDHFGTGSMIEGTAHRWNSSKNKYEKTNISKIKQSPLKVCIRDVHIIWNLFDGYDWQKTRDTITKAVQDVELKATEKRSKHNSRSSFDQDLDDDETVIGDFLFNSIYIGIPSNRAPGTLAAAINQELNDNATETESIAPTIVSGTTSYRASQPPKVKGKKLRLRRSKHHKITFELKGVNVDFIAFAPGSGETQSSIDVRVHDLDVFDHVPTSTWRKFATYMHDAGERESGSSQVHIEILNVKPQPDLAASEIVMKVTFLPLRLHVDQDALDFITRFFEFKDDSSTTPAASSEPPFLQRVEVNAIPVKLDFKPKRVDYAGLRSGRTTEFMNFIVLDEAEMVMRHCIIYGISGFDKMGKCLNDIWMPDIKRNQLPGILAGLAPVRSIANVGGGMVDLIRVPIEEYKKDGRVVRSVRTGLGAFGRTTGIELVRLGAKLGYGTQAVLEKVEQFVTDDKKRSISDDDESDAGEKNQVSLYANQPLGVMQGLRGGYAGLSRDIALARDAIIAIPGAVMDSGNAIGAAAAVGSSFPTIVLRPAIGLAKGLGRAATGIANQMDPENVRRAEEVCYFPFESD